MSESLYPYYERELIFIRRLAREFAERYPAAAGRLLIEGDRSADPHVERMIESFALLAGRVRAKIDDDLPEITDALLNVLYPHYLAPIPSMAVVRFELDAARGRLPKGFTIPRHSRLRTKATTGVTCRYRTGYPITLWPLKITEARLLPPPFPAGTTPTPETASILKLRFELLAGLTLDELEIEGLRLHLNGEVQFVASLYEAIFNRSLRVSLHAADRGSKVESVYLSPSEALRQVGFELDDSLLPYPRQSFLGYRLLTEFFAYPTKFLFVDLAGFAKFRGGGVGVKTFDVMIELGTLSDELEQGVNADTFLLGCAPAVNLFEQTAEPIAMNFAETEYRVLPDVANVEGTEVYRVDSVESVDPSTGRTSEYQPFYAIRHETSSDDARRFWYASRKPSRRPDDRGTDVDLTLVDLDFNPRGVNDPTLVVRTLCTNRDLPSRLRRTGDRIGFELEAAAPIQKVHCVRLPSPTLRPPARRGAYWRLISHLSLNHLSIADSEEGREAFREMLRLYDFSDPEVSKQMSTVNAMIIDSIVAISSRRVVGRVGSSPEGGGGFCRGVEVTIEFDEQKLVGTGVFLFASVIDRFLGLYASLNSFTQLVARTRENAIPLKTWPPRAGDRLLL